MLDDECEKFALNKYIISEVTKNIMELQLYCNIRAADIRQKKELTQRHLLFDDKINSTVPLP